jgi:hypothetical protein
VNALSVHADDADDANDADDADDADDAEHSLQQWYLRLPRAICLAYIPTITLPR